MDEIIADEDEIDVHCFRFKPEYLILYRISVKISEDYSEKEYDTGCTIWESSIVLSHWIMKELIFFSDKSGF